MTASETTAQASLTPLISEPRAAEILGVDRKTVARLRWSGAGPAYVKIGARILYRQPDLEEWILRRRQHSTAENGRAR